ncbi:MAG: phosphotransferase [Thermomicrobiales bacterium]
MASPAAELRAVLAAWGIGEVLAAHTPPTGTMNGTTIVATPQGDRIVRAYRHRDRAPIDIEHTIIAHVRAHGLPAVGPLPLPDGTTILEWHGRFFALFPRAEGIQIERSQLGAVEAAAMGRCLARLHRALATLPPSATRLRSFSFDRAAALDGNAQLAALIRGRAARDALDALALAWLAGQREWLLGLLEGDPPDLAALPFQVIHGDYQETNLFFAAGEVCAVIDWDQTYAAPRAWEVLRVLDLALRFMPALCCPFVAAYREVSPLPLAELDLAMAVYARKVGHSLWLYDDYYRKGNTRLAQFFPPDGFISPADAWAALRPYLAV